MTETVRNWTDAQKAAFLVRGRNLLVSAAAGSGKTAVLTERILRRLTDPDRPGDIRRMLVVTFTRAATAELKDRIGKKLSSALEKAPDDKHLSRQLLALGGAKISTIDSFCIDLVKRHFNQLDLPIGLKTLDDGEDALLRREIMDEMIEAYYDPARSAGEGWSFPALAERLITGDHDDTLADLLLSLYTEAQNEPEGLMIYQNRAKELSRAAETGEGLLSTPYGVPVKKVLTRLLDHFEAVYRDALSYFELDPAWDKAYHPAFKKEAEEMATLRQALESQDDASLYTLLNTPVDTGRLGTVKKENQTEEIARFRAARDDRKKKLKDLTASFFSGSPDSRRAILSDSASLLRDVYRFLSAFSDRLMKEKTRRGSFTFSDYERFAYRLLVGEDGKPTETALALRSTFDEIYIDEYQDVNRLQDAIFAALSDRNRFMVGDIKQSIYGFRGADPYLFDGYRSAYPPYRKGEDGESSTIFLSDNFRSDRGVIRYANAVCSRLFPQAARSIHYQKEDDLICANPDALSRPLCPVETVLVTKRDEAESGAEAEASYVADRILDLLDRGYQNGEIALLFRKGTSIPTFERVLSEKGIRIKSRRGDPFFETPEVLMALDLLNAVDNPLRDAWLAGLMRSPIIGFTLDDLIRLRRAHPSGVLYDSVREGAADPDWSERCGRLLELIEEGRRWAASAAASDVIRRLWNRTDLTVLAGAECCAGLGEAERPARAALCRKRLFTLYDKARRSSVDLHTFLSGIRELAEQRKDLASEEPDAGDYVRLMTVHNAKGLEFRVCFLCSAGGAFNREESKKIFVSSPETGPGMILRKDGKRYDTPLRRAAGLAVTDGDTDEEMRVLYVALTRAREQLIVTAGLKDDKTAAGMLEKAAWNAAHFDAYTVHSVVCPLSWILGALYADQTRGEYAVIRRITADGQTIDETAAETADEPPSDAPVPPPIPGGIVLPNEAREEDDAAADAAADAAEVSRLREIFERRFAFDYPYRALADLPSKLTVSRLYPGVLDEEDDGDRLIRTVTDAPRFVAADPAAVTGAERGTATHVFMQFCDFKQLKRNGVRLEAARLVSERFMDPAMAELIRTDQVERFLESPLFDRMCAARTLSREVRFNIRLPAAPFASDEAHKAALAGETVLVQGVIDCFFTEEGDDGNGLVLVDYKTDSFSRESLAEPEKVKAELLNRHSRQLNYYRMALQRLTGRPVRETLIYSFALHDTVAVSPDPDERT